MKVAVIIDTWFPFVGGGQINAWEISKRIAQNGNQVEIVTRNLGKDNLISVKNLKITKIGKKSTASNQFSKIIFVLKSLNYILKQDYDIIHAHAFLPGITLFLHSKLKKTPTVFTVHGTAIGSSLNGYLSSFIETIILTKLKYSAQITVSRDFLKIKNINKKIIFVSNGVDSAFLKPLSLKREKQLCCVARLHPQKNLANLIKGFLLLKEELPSYKLIIAGEGPQKRELQNLINDLKLSKKVKLVGNLSKEELKKLYSISQLFVLPSIYEGQPLALLEAMTCGLRVVATNTGDIPYVFRNLKNCYLIKNPSEPKNIAHVIKSALRNKLEKSTKQSEKLKDELQWEKSAEQTCKLYLSVIR